MTLTDDCVGDEEPDLPEKYTEAELLSWCHSKNKRVASPSDEISVRSDSHGLLRASEQHQHGLSVFMKRCRRDIIYKPQRPDLKQNPNSKLAPYLQDIERFNVDLMNRAQTAVHCTLPNKSVIESERQAMKLEGKKLWHDGLVLRKNSTLVDQKWKKEVEEAYISKLQRETREKTVHVVMGVLDQWHKTQDTCGIQNEPSHSRAVTSSKESNNSGSLVKHFKSPKEYLAKDSDENWLTLETVNEDDEDSVTQRLPSG